MCTRTLIAFTLAFGTADAQSKRPVSPGEEEYRRLQEGMKVLHASVTTDRADYLQGENVCFTISLSNPSKSHVAAVPPFPLRRLPLVYMQKKDGEWEVMHRNGGFGVSSPSDNMMEGVRTISVSPAEVLTERYCTADDGSFGGVPPGEYKAWFAVPHANYHASAEFEVQEVLGESALARVAVPEMERTLSEKSPSRPGCLGIAVAALRTSKTTVLVSRPAGVCDNAERGKDLLRALSGFTRIAEVREGVTKLSLEPLRDGTTAVMWTTGAGVEKEHRLTPPVLWSRP